MFTTYAVRTALTNVNRTGSSPFGLCAAYDAGLVEVSPFTGYYTVSAKGAAVADATAWKEEEEYVDLAAFDPSKF